MTAAAHRKSVPAVTAVSADLVAVVVGLGLLVLVGRRGAADPPWTSPTGLQAWVGEQGSVALAMAMIRVGALMVAAYVALTSGLAAVASLTHRSDLARWVDAVTLPPLRAARHRLLALALAATSSVVGSLPGGSGAAASPAPPVTASVTPVDPGGSSSAPEDQRPRSTATLVLIESGASSSANGPAAEAPSPPQPTVAQHEPAVAGADTHPSAAPTTPAPASAAGTEVDSVPEVKDSVVRRVAPGDHLWGLATGEMAARLGRNPTDAEVAPYWRRVVLANPQLADPDLLFVGDEVTLPPVPNP